MQGQIHLNPGSSSGLVEAASDRETELELRFQRMVETAPHGILIVDADGRITLANPRISAQFGYTQDELLGAPVELLVPERFREAHPEQRQTFLQHPTPRPVGAGRVLFARRRDGSEFPVDIGLVPLESERGMEVACTIVDLSERLWADRALAESEWRLREILDNTSAVIYVKALDGRYLLINRQFERLFGVSRNQACGMTDQDLFPSGIADAFQANDRIVAETNRILEIEETAPHSDGPHTYISVKFPLRNTSGELYAVAGISTDITERVLAQEELAQIKDQFELILNSISDGIVGLSREGEPLFVNRAVRQLLGCAPDADVNPHQVLEMLSRLRKSRQPAAIDDTDSAAGDDDEGSGLFRQPDGDVVPLEFRVSRVQTPEQELGAVIMFRDVSDRKAREAIEHDVESARAVQQVLLPRQSPRLEGFDIAGSVYPATSLCGDYLDFLTLSDGRLAAIVGDVSGHGFGPAVQMVGARAYFRGALALEIPLDTSLERLNNALLLDTPESSFLTLFCACIDPPTRSLTYAAAGHDAWLVNESSRRRLKNTGLVLGIQAAERYERVGPIPLERGDVLVLLTDGVIETQSPQQDLFGWERTLRIIERTRDRPAAHIVEALYQATRCFADGRPPADDVTIAIIKAL
jgi:phosphoserine phosphatase RsbU/P